MATWKDRGYVPDSDEEDDWLPHVPRFSQYGKSDNDAQLPSEGNALADKTTAEKLGESLNHGLSLVHEALSINNASLRPLATEIDSPLSSLSSSPSAPPTSPKRTQFQSLHDVLLPHLSSAQYRSRNLRQRTAIQQNPYSLEDAKYRQQFQERGLRPVRVHRQPSPELGQDAEESQHSDLQHSTQITSQSLVSSQIGEDTFMSDSLRALHSDLPLLDDDVDLPDLSDIIANPNSTLPRKSSNKASERNASISNQTPGLSSKLRLYKLRSSPDDKAKKGNKHNRHESTVPTPPLSDTRLPANSHVAEVLWNRAASPAALPTPLVSSEVQSRKRLVISDDSSSESVSTQPSTTDDEVQVFSEDDSQQVQAVARRTKGVLPASWLRLDKARQASKFVRQPTRRQSFTAVPEKGIALRKIRAHRNVFDDGLPNTTESLQSSDTDIELSARQFYATETLRKYSPGARIGEVDENGQDLDISEEDIVDRMLPPTERHPTKHHRKRQQLVGTSFSHRMSASRTKDDEATPSRIVQRSRGSAGAKPPQKKRKMFATKHTMTVLNAPGLRSPTKEHQPRFLRIAARNARRSEKPKLVQPKRQMFSLATVEDNGDMDDAFDEVKRQASHAAVKRSEGYKETHAQTTVLRVQPDATRANSGEALAMLKSSSETILQRQRGNHTSSRSTSEVQNPLSSHGLHLTRLRTLLPLNNRSGRGHLISRSSHSRIAQVEAPYMHKPGSKIVRQKPRPVSHKPDQQPNLQTYDVTRSEPRTLRKQPRKRKPTQRRLIVNPEKDKDQSSEKSLIVELDSQEHSAAQSYRNIDSEQSSILTTIAKLRDTALDHHTLKVFYAGLHAIGILDNANAIGETRKSQSDESSTETGTLPLTNLREAECRTLNCWTSWSAKTFMENYSVISQHLHELESLRFEEESTTMFSALKQMFDFAHANMACASTSDATAFLEVSYDGLWKISHALNSQELQSQPSSKSVTVLINLILKLSEETCRIERQYAPKGVLTNSGEGGLNKVGTTHSQLALQALRRIIGPTALLAWFDACTTHETDGTIASNSVLAHCEVLLLAMRAYRCSDRGAEQFWHDLTSVINAQNLSLDATLFFTLLAIALIMSLSGYVDKNVPGNPLQYHETTQTILADLLHKSRAFNQSQKTKSDAQRTRLLAYSMMSEMWHNHGWKPLQKVLLIWFQDCQKFWFSDLIDSKSSHLHSNKQNSFRLFLRALALHVDRTYEEGSEPAIQKLRSVLFSLTPNRGRIGEQGQIGEKTRSLDVRDVQLVRNVFDLHVEMIRHAPRFAPRVRTLEVKVDFSTAHLAICRVALSAWESVASRQEHEVTSDLSSWYQTMIHQSIQRWHLAESDIRKELEETPHRFSAVTIKNIIHANQEEASELMGNVIEALRPQMQTFIQGDHPRSEFICELVHSVLQIPSSEPVLSELLVTKALDAVKAAVNELGRSVSTRLVPALVKGIKQSIMTQLGGRTVPSARLIRLCVESYVDVAKIAVALRHNHWDEFLIPSSSYALGMLVDHARLDQATTILYAKFIDAEPSIFALECRNRIFEHWLQELVRPSTEHSFVSLLTHSLFQYETESLMLTDLSNEYKDSDGGFSEVTIQQNTSHIQRTAIKHIIRQLHAQESEPEADWLVGGLEEADALRLLSAIFSTLKSTWLSLSTRHDKQVEYERLIDDILAEYEVFPRQDFKLDPWFYSALSVTARRRYSLHRAFELRGGRRDLRYSKEDIARTFARELEQAVDSDQSDELSHRLETVFLPTDLALITEANKAGMYAVDLKAQAEFISMEFPKHVLTPAAANDRNHAKTALLCNLLCHILENLEFRIDSLNLDTVTPLLSAVQRVINVICIAIDGGCVQPAALFKLIRLTFDWIVMLNVDSVSEQFWADVETVCAIAATVDGNEAMQLLETVIEQS